MPIIKVKFFAGVREITKTPETEIEVNETVKLIDFMQLLAKKYGTEFRKYVLSDGIGRISSHIILMVNGEPVRNLAMYLKENDILAILPPVSGGMN